MIGTQIFNDFFNSDDSIYYLPNPNPKEDERIIKMLKGKEVDLTFRNGVALVRCVDRYSDKYLKHITQDSLLEYMSNEFRAVNLSLVIAKKYIKDKDSLPLDYLLRNEVSQESYKAMVLLDLLPEGLQGMARSSDRDLSNPQPLWKVIFPFLTPSSIREIIRDYLGGMGSYKMFSRDSAMVHFAVEAYDKYPSKYNLNLVNEVEKAYSDSNRIFPLQDNGYDLPEWRSYKIELYLRMSAQYLSGRHLLVEVLPWNKLGKYLNLIRRFVVDMTTIEELQSKEEFSGIRLASKEHENYNLIKDLLEDRTRYLLGAGEKNIVLEFS